MKKYNTNKVHFPVTKEKTEEVNKTSDTDSTFLEL
jgi:hypothetical protein